MDSNVTHSNSTGRTFRTEFNSWPVEGTTLETVNEIRSRFDELTTWLESKAPSTNGRYVALVNTKLEEACMFAVKAVTARPN